MSDRKPPLSLTRPARQGTRRLEPPNDAAKHPIRIDLGCGAAKRNSFIGVDRFALPGVDLVCDLERGIPLATDSVDYLIASHSLEHFRDLPPAIAEIYRVCKDRAHITIVAPYDATRLNRANPYHFQVWNEHTARFFTAENAPNIDPADYRFPAAEHWGLQASDFSQSSVDLRCLRMEFFYLPPYRGLDEDTKRTLRQSLSDVCDQMALHLLVVKSAISQEELSRQAGTIQHPVPAAFEARRRAESDASTKNLFSELATTPARVAALSAETDEKIGLLGAEVRSLVARSDHLDRALVAGAQQREGVVQRVDHIDRALVAQSEAARRALSELEAAGRNLGERMTAINSALTRRMQAAADELNDDLSRKLAPVLELSSAQALLGDQISYQLVAERRARADRAFWPIRFLRRYRQRGLDLRGIAGGALLRLWEGPDAPHPAALKLQLGAFLEANVARVYQLMPSGAPLRGIDIGIAAMFPPPAPSKIADFELIDDGNNVLRTGAVNLDRSCGSVPVPSSINHWEISN